MNIIASTIILIAIMPEKIALVVATAPHQANDTFHIAAVAIFLIVFICSHLGLRRAGVFGCGSRLVLAACTAALSVIALMRSPSPWWEPIRERIAAPYVNPEVEGLLLPYAALGLTMILIPLLLFLLMCVRGVRNMCMRRIGETESEPMRTTDRVSLRKCCEGEDARRLAKSRRGAQRTAGEIWSEWRIPPPESSQQGGHDR